eukprot:scaffold676659_cov59-Prasinocladus_malaysianus.AAC.1
MSDKLTRGLRTDRRYKCLEMYPDQKQRSAAHHHGGLQRVVPNLAGSEYDTLRVNPAFRRQT